MASPLHREVHWLLDVLRDQLLRLGYNLDEIDMICQVERAITQFGHCLAETVAEAYAIKNPDKFKGRVRDVRSRGDALYELVSWFRCLCACKAVDRKTYTFRQLAHTELLRMLEYVNVDNRVLGVYCKHMVSWPWLSLEQRYNTLHALLLDLRRH
jgi:hypothetical protein